MSSTIGSSSGSSSGSAVAQPAQRTKTALPRLPHISFGQQVIAGLVLGVLLGLLARAIGPVSDGSPNWLGSTLNTIGSLFVTLLKTAVVPLVFTAIVASIANLRKVTNAARLAGQTILWFAITALIAVSIGIVLGLVLRPGAHAGVSANLAKAPSHTGDWWAFLTGLVPSNFLGVQANTSLAGSGAAAHATTAISFNVLQLIVVAAAIGIAALKVGEKATPFIKLNESALEIVTKVLWWIIRLAPIGTVGLLGNAVVSYGWTALGSLGVFTLAIYIGLAIVLLVVYPTLLRVHGLSVRQFFSGVWPATQLGFVSRSSLGTMPVTEQVAERRLGVPREYASFAVPLGATTKMDGCAAVYPAVASIFVAQFFGVHLRVTDYLLIAVVSVVGSAATAGTTGAVVMLTLTLSTLGLPLAGVGLLIGIDPILDMGRTAINVTGQALVPTIVAKRERILNEAVYKAPRSDELFAGGEDATVESSRTPQLVGA
jgi:Na+/H+-dicarboxylate symporter